MGGTSHQDESKYPSISVPEFMSVPMINKLIETGKS